eukprot:COSAG01_NODE_66430_length_270_cov_0.602339_1_plen_38_part_01
MDAVTPGETLGVARIADAIRKLVAPFKRIRVGRARLTH